MNRRVSGTTKVAAVVGWPIAHSLSPTIHNVGFDSTGVDWTYVALGVRPESGDTILSSCSALGIRGVSVTMPFKTVLAAQVERLDDTCRRLGSLNTISFDDHGSTTGHSTDGDGLIASLLAADVEFGAQRLLVLGTGGAGRSVIEAASRRHPRSLLVSNRTAPDRELISSISSGMAEIVPWDDRSSALREVDIVINCTSIGMGDDRHLPFDPNAVGPAHVVVELIYHPIRTALMDAAQTRGARVVGGLGMLIHQAALQQQIWTGHLPDVEAMTRSALSALGERR